MATKHLRVLMPTKGQTDHEIEELGGAVLAGVYDNPDFTTPPVDKATLQTALNEYSAALAATVQGGTHATNEKNKKRQILIGHLRKLGLYVQGNCNDEPASLTSSGFRQAATTRTFASLPKPVIARIENGHTTQLLVTVEKVPQAKSYDLRMAPPDSSVGSPITWPQVGIFTRSRALPVDGLAPGVNYTFAVRAIGGTTQYSDWSDRVSHMSL